WAAALVWIVDRQFVKASAWMFAGAVLSCFGVIHAYRITPQGIENHLELCGCRDVPAYLPRVCN
ncbi:MAG TPA: hypothetical protein VFE02_00095, partial [Candidatus Acidoferrales bacterium]|nr:hypothetical protein [Candidatus Acidoferrales bacterium]